MIQAKNYIDRRRRLAAACDTDAIIVTGSDLIQKSSDETYEFVQDGHFYYLTGIDEQGWILVIDRVQGLEYLISTDESSYHSDVWDVRYSHADVTRISGIKEIVLARDGWGRIGREMKNYPSIGTLVPQEEYSDDFGMYINPAKVKLIRDLRALHSEANLMDIGLHLRRLRSVKEPAELKLIRESVDLTAGAFKVITDTLAHYEYESDIHADLAHFAIINQSKLGYEPVVASGSNTSKLHYKVNNKPLETGHVLMIDAGISKHHYTADITRTYQIGKVSKRYQEIWRVVHESQAVFMEHIKPGMTMIDIEAFAEKILGQVLIDLKITNNKLRKTVRTYYPHAFGHHLGIDVHDSCTYDEPLQPGAVITVEPGIYIPEEGIGVRVEDNIVITETGIEVLSANIPHAPSAQGER